MAFDFRNTYQSRLTRAASFINTSDPRPCSVAFWMRASGHQNQSILSNNRSAGAGFYVEVENTGTHYKIRIYSNGFATAATTGIAEDLLWHHYGVSWAADNSIAYYSDGAADGTPSLAMVSGGSDIAVIGALTHVHSGFHLNGHMAELTIFDRVLTAGEFGALGAGFSPRLIAPENHVAIFEMVAPLSGIDRNLVEDATALTAGSTAVLAVPHPPIIYPGRQIVIPGAAADLGATVDLGNLEAIAEMNDPTVTPGATTASLPNLECVGELLDPSPTPGGVTTSLSNLEAVAELLDLALTPGAATLSPGLLEAVAELNDTVPGPGSVSLVLPLLEAVAELNGVVPSTGVSSITLPLLEAVAELNLPVPAPGGTSITLSLLEAVAEMNDVVPSSGAVSLVIDDLEAVAELLGPSFSLGAVSVAPGILEAVAELLDPVVSIGASTISPGNLEAVAEMLDPTFSPGGVSFNLGLLEAVGEILDVMVIPGGVSITVDVLEAPASLNDLGLTPGTATLSLDVLEAVLVLLSPTFPGLFTGILTRMQIGLQDPGVILAGLHRLPEMGLSDPGLILMGSA